MINLSRTFLCGFVAADPEIRTLERTGKKMVRFTLMTHDRWNDPSNGGRRDVVERHRVVVFNDQLAEMSAALVRRGAKLLVEGQNRTRRYTDAAGVERQITEVVLGPYKASIELLDAKGERSLAPPDGDGTPPGGAPTW